MIVGIITDIKSKDETEIEFNERCRMRAMDTKDLKPTLVLSKEEGKALFDKFNEICGISSIKDKP